MYLNDFVLVFNLFIFYVFKIYCNNGDNRINKCLDGFIFGR